MCVVCNCAYILLDYEKADLKHFEKGTLYHRRLLHSTVEQGSESTQKKQAPWTMDAMLVLLAYHEWRLKLSLLRASWCSPAVLSSPQGLMNRPFLSLSLSLSLSARECENLPDYALQSKLVCWLMPGAMFSGSSLGRSMKKTGLKEGLTKGSSVHCPVRNKPPGKGCPTVQGQWNDTNKDNDRVLMNT